MNGGGLSGTNTPAKRYSEIIQILEDAVQGQTIGGPHHNFWRGLTRDQFIAKKVLNRDLIVKKLDGSFDPDESNLVKALEGRAPFGNDIGTPGATIPRMPVGFDPVPAEKIGIIRKWIQDGCPDDTT